MDRLALLASIPLFEGLSSDDLESLSGHCVELRIPAGQMIFHQGARSDAMYIVEQGHVNIHLPGEDSRRISLKDITRGEYFGELSLFDDKPRSASVLATTDVVLLQLDRVRLTEYLDGRPRAAMALLKMMAGRMRETNAMLSQRAAKNVVEEIDRSLTWKDRLADKVAELNGSWAFIALLLLLIVVWTVVNSTGLTRFDPYPYVFFNLLLAIVVALQGPLIVMSQNRQARKDRRVAETDFQVNLKNELNIETILRELGEFRAESNTRLEKLEKRDKREPSAPRP